MICQQYRTHKGINEDLNGVCSFLSTNFEKPQPLVVELMKRNDANSNNNNNTNNNNNNNNNNIQKVESATGFNSPTEANSNNNNNNAEDLYPDEEEDGGTEIAFVLDGSGSIEKDDFQRAKDFISNMTKNIWENCFSCGFAIVQYGEEIQTELTLNENSDTESVLKKVQDIKQLGNITKTASAIQHVLDNIFIEEKGSQKNARKIIIVITDGDIFGIR
ncbi:integrin alpha-E-like isoform X1 [Acipenser oxyrinchus oxyrinchus]|uniref:Integrin alpha-E-like isoform X1 n=1 Tax=Acipenser oxyrinchus oxyrinchus TaxID=40147 RepID=A0AAD8CH85_ACIOX|nr:integrin alpha-E-like isoform X1 [Acipenser oxyrinchus oxyrinchus]